MTSRSLAQAAVVVVKPSTALAPIGNVLDRQFAAPAPNRRWVTDITFLTTVQGWLYLAVVLDLFSRRVVGWATSDRLGEGLALEALTMSLARRRPAGGSCTIPTGGRSTSAISTAVCWCSTGSS